jgi:peptidoglycan-N-acetylglucosamine deacetylase
MKNTRSLHSICACAIFLCAADLCSAQKIALTFDDLPLNGTLPAGVTRVEITRDTLAVLNKRHVPQVYGFVNAKKLEDNQDAADALKLWAASELVGNHTYSHMNLNANSADAFEHEVEQNEPVLEVLAPQGSSWRWLRYPYLAEGETIEKRRAVRAYLEARHYRIAQVTIDWEDYMWNSAYARCQDKHDAKSMAWLRSSYLKTASEYVDLDRAESQLVFGREINYVLLLHLGAFSSTILPDALDLLAKKGFQLVPLEESESDPAYQSDPDVASANGGTLLDQWMDAKKIKYPPVAEKPYKEVREICQ